MNTNLPVALTKLKGSLASPMRLIGKATEVELQILVELKHASKLQLMLKEFQSSYRQTLLTFSWV